MADVAYIHENRAMLILTQRGDFTASQAAIILAHSRKQEISGSLYYPLAYIEKRARDNAAKPEPDAWSADNERR